jgi:hypothetical protein
MGSVPISSQYVFAQGYRGGLLHVQMFVLAMIVVESIDCRRDVLNENSPEGNYTRRKAHRPPGQVPRHVTRYCTISGGRKEWRTDHISL